MFALVALVGFAVHLVSAEPGWSALGTLGRGFGWVLAASLLGKLLGLGYARLRVAQLRAELAGVEAGRIDEINRKD